MDEKSEDEMKKKKKNVERSNVNENLPAAKSDGLEGTQQHRKRENMKTRKRKNEIPFDVDMLHFFTCIFMKN